MSQTPDPFTFLGAIEDSHAEVPETVALATVAASTAEGFTLTFDGEDDATEKSYRHVSSSPPEVGDRVAVALVGSSAIILGTVRTGEAAGSFTSLNVTGDVTAGGRFLLAGGEYMRGPEGEAGRYYIQLAAPGGGFSSLVVYGDGDASYPGTIALRPGDNGNVEVEGDLDFSGDLNGYESRPPVTVDFTGGYTGAFTVEKINGVVYWYGHADGGTVLSTSGATIANLPYGYRPRSAAKFYCGGSTVDNEGLRLIGIDTDGTVAGITHETGSSIWMSSVSYRGLP